MNVVNTYISELENIYYNFHFLNNSFYEINNVRFIGSTLWSNFNLSTNFFNDTLLCKSLINDFHNIFYSENTKISIENFIEMSNKFREFLSNSIDPQKKNVIITHFAPSRYSFSPKYVEKYKLLFCL